MRIKENFHEGNGLYTHEVKQYVEHILSISCEKIEVVCLFESLKIEAERLMEFFMQNGEYSKLMDSINFFDERMQIATLNTYGNLESYLIERWKSLLFDEYEGN